LAWNITKKLDVNDCGFAHLTLILLLHYLVKCGRRSLAAYNNKFILGSACIGSVIVSRWCYCRWQTVD